MPLECLCLFLYFWQPFYISLRASFFMLPDREIKALSEELLNCKNPLFLFHDDPDGVCSYLLFYRVVREGKFLVIKSTPLIGVEPFARKADEYGSDKVFVLDIAMVEQDFVDEVRIPVVWVDHHDPQELQGVKYFNPRLHGSHVPTSDICWRVVCDERPEDLWLAVAGCIGDWHMPSFASALHSADPDLLPHTGDVPDILFNSKMGTLVKVLAFNLKGSTSDVMKSVKVLSRINSPYEILDQSTSQGKFLWKRFDKINRTYERLKKEALNNKVDKGLFVFTYSDDNLSVTKDLANELLYELDCVVVVGRERLGEYRCSLRCPEGLDFTHSVPAALKGVEGRGGGHEHAHGVAVKKEDFEQFLKNLRRELKLK